MDKDRRKFLLEAFAFGGSVACMSLGFTPAQIAWAGMVQKPKKKEAAGGDCPSGTYDAYWDGDHSTSDVTVCTNNGAGTATFTQSGGTITTTGGEAGQGNSFAITGSDQYLTRSQSINETLGTIWRRVKIVDPNADRPAISYFSEYTNISDSGNNNIRCMIMHNAETCRVIWEGNATETTITSTNVFTPNTFFWFGYSWDLSAGAGFHKHSIYVNSGWEETGSLTITAHNNIIDTEVLGEQNSGSYTEDLFIDRASYIGGAYQATNPGL